MSTQAAEIIACVDVCVSQAAAAAEEEEGLAVYLAGWRRSPCWGAGRRRSAGFGSARCWRRASPGLPTDGRIRSAGGKRKREERKTFILIIVFSVRQPLRLSNNLYHKASSPALLLLTF